MKFDLIKPCKHCPFRKDETAIRFTGIERAEEVEELAYRQGFVCHEHGEDVETPDGESYISFRDDGTSQHCFGALWMYLNGGGTGNVPWQEACSEDEELETRWWDRIDMDRVRAADALVYDSEESFLESYR